MIEISTMTIDVLHYVVLKHDGPVPEHRVCVLKYLHQLDYVCTMMEVLLDDYIPIFQEIDLMELNSIELLPEIKMVKPSCVLMVQHNIFKERQILLLLIHLRCQLG